MSQINVNAPPPSDGGDRSAAAGINLVAVLIVLLVLAVLAWFLFTGPLSGVLGGGSTTNINVTVPTPASGPPSQPSPKP